MDLPTLEAILPVHDDEELRAALTGDLTTSVLAGGTWLFSVPQPHLRTLVDVTTLGWEPFTVTEQGLRISATCPISALLDLPAVPGWRAQPLVKQCVRALLASFKVRSVATVGGNICLSLPAGSMTSLTAALEGVVELWAGDGCVRRLPVAEFVTGDTRNALAPGEVLRAIDVPAAAMRARTAFRRTSLSRLGRSASLVIGRFDPDGGFVLTVTAATSRPVLLRYPELPDPAAAVVDVAAAVDAGPGWFDDVHGAPDWRRAMTLRSAAEVTAELGGAA
ncbi:MAG: FAD binding domain-containing protein [Janthinobacterium lividum]